ncbi:MAG: hypothetical protein Q9182_000562 [Xanthomendoza sp. 2 TL-2023]
MRSAVPIARPQRTSRTEPLRLWSHDEAKHRVHGRLQFPKNANGGGPRRLERRTNASSSTKDDEDHLENNIDIISFSTISSTLYSQKETNAIGRVMAKHNNPSKKQKKKKPIPQLRLPTQRHHLPDRTAVTALVQQEQQSQPPLYNNPNPSQLM